MAAARQDGLRPGHLYAGQRQQRRVRHCPQHQEALPVHPARRAHPVLARHHRPHGTRGPEHLRVCLLLAGQYRPAALHHQAHRGQDEPGARRQGGRSTDDSRGGGLHPLLLVRATQPLPLRAGAEQGVRHRGTQRPSADAAYARTSENRAGTHLRGGNEPLRAIPGQHPRGHLRRLIPPRGKERPSGRRPSAGRDTCPRPVHAAYHGVVGDGEP